MVPEKLFATIYGLPFDDDKAENKLEHSVKEFPYFSLPAFLQLKKNGLAAHHALAAKTALHFNNPFLLNELLHPSPILTEQVYPKDKIAVEETSAISNANDTVSETIDAHADTEAVNNQELTTDESIEAREEPLPDEVTASTPSPIGTEIPADVEAIVPVSPAEPEAPSQEEATENTQPSKPEPDELLFQPLFTTDYFASQGIRLSEEMQSADKLGKQLRSFTDWLKTMKKVHESKLPAGNEQMDASVQKLAEKSNQDEAVVTEAMAEALIQQGKFVKARELYLKLSLLNPAKSVFFAAKIEELNKK
ncbi:MAG: hypothetical protein JWQ27_3296 [Ferruginibacter sp.]|nr:hypothetical protein [Ferruginibacter sp.]